MTSTKPLTCWTICSVQSPSSSSSSSSWPSSTSLSQQPSRLPVQHFYPCLSFFRLPPRRSLDHASSSLSNTPSTLATELISATISFWSKEFLYSSLFSER